MYCNNCGENLKEKDKFCGKCGTPITITKNNSNNYLSNRLIPVIITVAIILIATVIIDICTTTANELEKKLTKGVWYTDVLSADFGIKWFCEDEFSKDGEAIRHSYLVSDGKVKKRKTTYEYEWKISKDKSLYISEYDKTYEWSSEQSEDTWYLSGNTLIIGDVEYSREKPID